MAQPNTFHIPTSHLLEIHPNIIHPSTPRSPQWSPSGFPSKALYTPLSSTTRATCRSYIHILCTTNIFHAKKNWAKYDKKCVNYSLSFSDFNEIIILLLRFSKNIFKYQIPWKSFKWEQNCLMRFGGGGQTDGRTNGQTDRQKRRS